jgi:O-antigen ligase
MLEYLRTYSGRPWPKIEVPVIKKPHLWGLILYVAAMVGLGFWFWLSGDPRAYKFGLLGLAIPVLFLLKSPYMTIAGLLAFEVVAAFLSVGNMNYVISIVAVFIGTIIAFESPIVIYLLLILAVWYDSTPLNISGTMIIGSSIRYEILLGSALFVGWLFRYLSGQEVQSKKIFPEKWYAIGLLAITWMGFLFWCYEPFPTGWEEVKVSSVGLLLFMISPIVINDRKKLTLAIWSWIGAGVILAMFSFIGPYFGLQPEETESWGAAPGALGIHKNWSTTLMSFSFFITMAYLFTVKNFFKKIMFYFDLLFLLAAQLYEQSRATAISSVAGAMMFWLVNPYIKRSRSNPLRSLVRVFLVIAVLALTTFAIFTVDLSFLGSYSEVFSDPFSIPTMVARYEIWEGCYQMITAENHLWRGLGPGAFWYLGQYYGIGTLRLTDEEFRAYHAHNLYLDIVIHQGIIGLLLFLGLTISLLVRLWRGFLHFENIEDRYLCIGIFTCILAFLLHGMVDYRMFMIRPYWMFLGLAVALINLAVKPQSREANRSLVNLNEK